VCSRGTVAYLTKRLDKFHQLPSYNGNPPVGAAMPTPIRWPNSEHQPKPKNHDLSEGILVACGRLTKRKHPINLFRRNSRQTVRTNPISMVMVRFNAAFNDARCNSLNDLAISGVCPNMAPGALIQIRNHPAGKITCIKSKYGISSLNLANQVIPSNFMFVRGDRT
jgi:hypothetical protein